MVLIEDVNNKANLHIAKNNYFASKGIEVQRFGLPVGDYVLGDEKVMDVVNRKLKRGMTPHKMDFLGTYSVCVDTKKDMNEIEGNIIGKSHARFRDECILAQNNGIKLYILVENVNGIKEIRDVFRYTSTRRLRWFKYKKLHESGRALQVPLSEKPPVSGEQLAKAMLTMQAKYGVEFIFCKPQESGAKVIELLTQGEEKND